MNKWKAISIFAFLTLIIITCFIFGNCSSSDIDIKYKAALDFEHMNKYKEAIELFTKVSRSSKGNYLYYRAQADIARNYYFLNQLDTAGTMARTLLVSLPDTLNPRVSLDLRMILLSIERKTSLQEGGFK
jgi:predicted Zn-dependent protease